MNLKEMSNKGLLKICQDIHTSIISSSDVLDSRQIVEHADYLRRRLNEWEQCATEYDIRVRDLITTTIDEFDKHIERLDNLLKFVEADEKEHGEVGTERHEEIMILHRSGMGIVEIVDLTPEQRKNKALELTKDSDDER